MPPKPKRPCNKPGCPALTTERFCEKHSKQEQQRYDQERGTAHSRGYNKTWRAVRKQVLDEEPLCRRCVADGRVKPADLVHHVDRNPRNNSRNNLEPTCIHHHEEEHRDERFGRGTLKSFQPANKRPAG